MIALMMMMMMMMTILTTGDYKISSISTDTVPWVPDPERAEGKQPQWVDWIGYLTVPGSCLPGVGLQLRWPTSADWVGNRETWAGRAAWRA